MFFEVWCLDLSSGCLDLSFGCLGLSFGCLDLSFGCLGLSFECLGALQETLHGVCWSDHSAVWEFVNKSAASAASADYIKFQAVIKSAASAASLCGGRASGQVDHIVFVFPNVLRQKTYKLKNGGTLVCFLCFLYKTLHVSKCVCRSPLAVGEVAPSLFAIFGPAKGPNI